MLNTRASLAKVFAGLGLGLLLDVEDYQTMPPGGPRYPSLAVRVLTSNRQQTAHLGQRTPFCPAGGHREVMMVECEVRTQSATWNEAMQFAGTIRNALDETAQSRRTWLLDATTPNPNPADAGFVRFGVSNLTCVQDDQQSQFKSAFLTWECQTEVPI